ncbi:hypothetical protein [Methylobacterium brachythecii]|nr:hypothetical protein [Methylobacterium brachythecii]
MAESCRRRASHWRRAERLWNKAGNTLAAKECAKEAERCERRADDLAD